MTSPFLQLAGISLASGILLLMLALCFRVGQVLRPTWGLNWFALAMGISGVRALLFAFGMQGPQWAGAHELAGTLYLSALLVAMRCYGGKPVSRPVREFLLAAVVMTSAVVLGRAVGLRIVTFYVLLLACYAYMANLLIRPQANAGQTHVIFNVVVVLFPVLVPGIGIGLLHFETHQMPGWSSLSIAMLGVGLLLAILGRLRRELQVELEGRERAEGALRALNESLEQRIEARTEELEGLVAGLESFNRMVSHDLRDPLGGLSGLAELAQRAHEEADGPRLAKLLGLMKTESRRLGELVTRLLVLARVSNADLALSDTSLDAVLAEALQSLALSQGEAAMRHVQVQPLPHAKVDAQLMCQVFINLIGNALKFSRNAAAPAVQVRAESEKRSLVIEVRDNGPGFEPAQALSLFQPFRRLHGQQYEGSGIGLTIVKRIVERHGGQVWAVGRPTEGASFFFRLPAK